MREENLAGESFSGKFSTGDSIRDEKRAQLLEDQVKGMFERQDAKNMMPVIEDDRGSFYYYCKSCRHLGEISGDLESMRLLDVECDSCHEKGDMLAKGTKSSLISHYKVKL